MTVSTPTFDLLFNRLQRKEQRLAKLEANTLRAEAKIESLLEQPQSDKRDARINFLKGVNYSREFRKEGIQEDIDFLDSLLPKDEFVPSFLVDEVTGDNWGVSVTITDSPYDDTYVGGTPVGMQISGNYFETGTSGFAETRGIYFGESYPLIDATETIGFSTNRANGDSSFTVRLLDYNTRDSFYEQELIDSNGVQLI